MSLKLVNILLLLDELSHVRANVFVYNIGCVLRLFDEQLLVLTVPKHVFGASSGETSNKADTHFVVKCGHF